MIKKNAAWLLTAVVLYAVQSSFLTRIVWNGISAELLLLFIVSFSFLYGNRHGVWMGFCVGLLEDLTTGTFLGLNTFSKMILGYVSGSFSKKVFKEQLFLPVLAVGMASLLQYFLFIIILLLLGYSLDPVEYNKRCLLPVLLMNMIWALPVNYLVRKVHTYLQKEKQ